MGRLFKDLSFDQRGGVLVETTIMIPIIFLFVLGAVDFLFAFYQWNAATKAVQVGARIAAVSSPVASDVTSLCTTTCASLNPGDPMPTGTIATRTCSYSGSPATPSCTNQGAYSAAAMNTIVYGRGSNACGDTTSFYFAGMCDVFWRVQPQNVVVSYSSTGLGYVGRPGGPVFTITVSIQNLPFQFFFLGGLMGFSNISIPGLTTTITSEDLSSSSPTT